MRFLLASLVAGLSAAFASAQAPAPLQTPVAKSAAITQVSGGKAAPVVVNGCGSCANSDKGGRHFGGTVNPVGCGCWASERTFFWGGCKQFFNPQNTCGSGHCGRGGHDWLRNKCELPQYGNGLGAPANNCAGPFTYMNR